MGCGDACPLYPGKRYEDWDLDDPAGQDVDAVRPIRDEIGERVKALLERLKITPAQSVEAGSACCTSHTRVRQPASRP